MSVSRNTAFYNDDGSLLVVGEAIDKPGQMEVARFTRRGDIDRSFGKNGILAIQSPAPLYAGVALKSQDGPRYLVGGIFPTNPDDGEHLFLAKVTSSGPSFFDPTFGTNGMLMLSSEYQDMPAAAVSGLNDTLVIGASGYAEPDFQRSLSEVFRLTL